MPSKTLEVIQKNIDRKVIEIASRFGGKENVEVALEQMMAHLPKHCTPGIFGIVVELLWLRFTVNQFLSDLEQNQQRLEKSALYSPLRISENPDSNHLVGP
ncbi:hypothetical protein [Brevibacillus borstelensis]|uniref:hypothetical protein n=1 Tax=Brevibacillus borstelensis TaxID=45462 RepID=UPI0030BABF76